MNTSRKVQIGVVGAIILVVGLYHVTINSGGEGLDESNDMISESMDTSKTEYLKKTPNVDRDLAPRKKVRIENVIPRDEEDTLLVPSDDVLQSMDDNKLLDLWWSYFHTAQVLCRNLIRLGSLKDGGKEICIDQEYKPANPCLVYSMGSNFKTDFEVAVVKQYGCEIHTFDPSVPMSKNVRIPNGITFHMLGLGSRDEVNTQRWHMMTLGSIMKKFNHTGRHLDIFKVDIEGGEYTAIPQILESGLYKQVKQLCIEVHTDLNKAGMVRTLRLLRLLYEYGFRIFMRERNITGCLKQFHGKEITHCNELSLVNICYRDKCSERK